MYSHTIIIIRAFDQSSTGETNFISEVGTSVYSLGVWYSLHPTLHWINNNINSFIIDQHNLTLTYNLQVLQLTLPNLTYFRSNEEWMQ